MCVCVCVGQSGVEPDGVRVRLPVAGVKNDIAEKPCHTMRELDARLRLGFAETVNDKVLASTYRQTQKYEDEYANWAETDAVDTTGVVDAPDEVEADEANDTENMDGPQR